MRCSSGAEVRPATAADLGSIVALAALVQPAEAEPERFAALLRLAIAHLWLVPPAAAAPQLARAYLSFWAVADELQVHDLVVAPAARRRGHAQQLLTACHAFGHTCGAVEVVLEVRRSNLAARALYHKLGYRLQGERHAYYQAPCEDALLLRRDLRLAGSTP